MQVQDDYFRKRKTRRVSTVPQELQEVDCQDVHGDSHGKQIFLFTIIRGEALQKSYNLVSQKNSPMNAHLNEIQ